MEVEVAGAQFNNTGARAPVCPGLATPLTMQSHSHTVHSQYNIV